MQAFPRTMCSIVAHISGVPMFARATAGLVITMIKAITRGRSELHETGPILPR